MIELLCRIVSEVLDMAEVDPEADLLELGADSLAAIQIIERLSAEVDIDLDVDLVFDTASIRELADAIESALSAASPKRQT